MGLVHAYKKGEVPASKVSQAVKDAAKSMKKSSVKKYAKTKHDDLPLKKEERDYKDEYKKFQSSTKSKKYRAELNKYNRKKGTYGNGDGKDASHKGGKIVGFEKESKNRGRAEKSRLKKENSMNKLNEEQYFNPNGEFKKYMDKVFKQAGIKVIKFDPMKQSFWNGTWGGFYTVKSSNKVDMKGQGKVKRGSTVLPVYISRVGEIALGVSGGGFHPGKVGSSQVLKNLKDFKKSDLDESVEESVDENLLKQIKQAEKIAKSMSGNMTGAVKGIEKIRRGLSHHKRVKVALKKANEGLGDKFSKKISKHGGTRNKAEVGNILKYLIKKGDNKKDALDKIKQNYDYVSKKYRSASVSKKADILTSLQESITEGIFGKFDTGAGFKGNGMTVYDRNQEKAGDYKDIAHIGEDGKITIYDRKVKKEPKLMQSLNKISQEFKKTFKESVDENILNENPAAMAAATAMTKMKMKNPKTGKDVSAASALKNKDNPNHKKAKSIFQRLKDKFSKKKKEEPKNKMSAKDAAKSAGINITNFTREHLGEKKLREFIRYEIKKSVDESMTKQQADITLKQLGGNKFIAMTGAKQFSFGKQGLGFRIGKNSKSINYVRVDLKSNDLYDMEFIRIRGSKIKVVKKVTGVYNDQLQKIFTKHTGLYTSLGTMGR